MAAITPTLPTDSLYKFIAIFGLILVGFGLWTPERFVEADAKAREASKALEITNIRVDRKKAQVDRLANEHKEKLADTAKRIDGLTREKDALDVRRSELLRDLDKLERKPSTSTLPDITKRAEALKSEVVDLDQKILDQNAKLRQWSEEFKPIQAKMDEVMDELKIETQELKSFNEGREEADYQAMWWLTISAASIIIGTVMMVVGFRLWYRRVQVFQDIILRREAEPPVDNAG